MVKYWIYGIIGLNSCALLLTILFSLENVALGLLFGTVGAVLNAWSLLEQAKKDRALLRGETKKGRKYPVSGFLLRYSLSAGVLGISGFFSMGALFGCFFGLFSVRIVGVFLAWHFRGEGSL